MLKIELCLSKLRPIEYPFLLAHHQEPNPNPAILLPTKEIEKNKK